MDDLIGPYVKGLVFDCDGTIADTMPLHYEAWLEALGEHGVEFPEALFYEFAGIPTARIVEILNDRDGRLQGTALHQADRSRPPDRACRRAHRTIRRPTTDGRGDRGPAGDLHE